MLFTVHCRELIGKAWEGPSHTVRTHSSACDLSLTVVLSCSHRTPQPLSLPLLATKTRWPVQVSPPLHTTAVSLILYCCQCIALAKCMLIIDIVLSVTYLGYVSLLQCSYMGNVLYIVVCYSLPFLLSVHLCFPPSALPPIYPLCLCVHYQPHAPLPTYSSALPFSILVYGLMHSQAPPLLSSLNYMYMHLIANLFPSLLTCLMANLPLHPPKQYTVCSCVYTYVEALSIIHDATVSLNTVQCVCSYCHFSSSTFL